MLPANALPGTALTFPFAEGYKFKTQLKVAYFISTHPASVAEVAPEGGEAPSLPPSRRFHI